MKTRIYTLIIVIFALIGIGGGYWYANYASSANLEKLESQEIGLEQAVPAEQAKLIEEPQTLTIPKINVEADVEPVADDATGRMDVPKSFSNVGWYSPGYKPGQDGNAVIAGHLDTITGAPAVFYNIDKLSLGDEIIVTDKSGKNLTFEVTRVQSYSFDQVPLTEVFGKLEKPGLNLITCTGTWNAGARNYSNRLVVYTELKS